jgi:hypothetical protein
VRSFTNVHRLAGDEDVNKWKDAIAQHLAQVKDEITLTKLQRALKMPLVEVWLGVFINLLNLK